MRESYDFSNALQGAHYERYREGHNVRLIDEEEPQPLSFASETQTAAGSLESDQVSLDPDVRAAFPDSKSVNEALRLLIKAARSAQEFAEAS